MSQDTVRIQAYLRSAPPNTALYRAHCNARALGWLAYLRAKHPEGLSILRFRLSRALGYPISELSTALNSPVELSWLWTHERAAIEGYHGLTS